MNMAEGEPVTMEHALEAFRRLPAYDRLGPDHLKEDLFDLSRFQRFLDRVGNPEKGLPVVHVVGSKGKGSTVALVGSALQSLGKRVGVFMSPYIGHPTESTFVNGQPMTEAAFAELMERYTPLLESLPPRESITSFELLTAMALQYFHDCDVDFAVLETGLGGRLDATNVVESPIVSVICPIEKEHTALLGDSITSIAYEKLGIVREETPVVVAHQDHFVLEFARTVCAQKKADCVMVTGQYQASVLHRDKQGYEFSLKTPHHSIPRMNLSLLGDHQINNAITAWAVLETIFPDGFETEKVLEVWAYLTLPGRLQRLEHNGHELILDAAHTPRSARMLRRTLDELYPQHSFTFLLALLNDKDVESIVRNLIRVGDNVVVTQVDHPRALPARVIAETIQSVFAPHKMTVAITNNVSISWQKALKMGKNRPLCITGSFKLLGALYPRIQADVD